MLTEAVLFGSVFGSRVIEETVAESTIESPFAVTHGTLTVSVNCAVAPFASEAAVQVTSPLAPTAGVVHDQPAGAVIDWKVVDDGTVSTNETFAASSWPLFSTVIV